jgi:hypothetical protein
MESHSRILDIYMMKYPTYSVVILKDIAMVIAFGILQSSIWSLAYSPLHSVHSIRNKAFGILTEI